jgi:hypothetical protein
VKKGFESDVCSHVVVDALQVVLLIPTNLAFFA